MPLAVDAALQVDNGAGGLTPAVQPVTNTQLRATPVPVVLDAATLAALEAVTATIANLPADYPDAAVLAKLEAVRAALVGTLVVSGPVTDAQLRATPVPVSFTADELGLTNAELRATAVPISGTVALEAASLTALETIGLDAATLAALESVTAVGPLTNTELRASAPAVKDDFQGGECLAEQTGAGAVLTFTFSAPVQLVHVEGNGAATDIARVDPFGGSPTATLGFRAGDEVGLYLPVTCTVVKVWAPVGMVVAVNGFRRS